MQTLTKEEFEKKYGVKTSEVFKKYEPAEQKPSLLNRVGSVIGAAGTNVHDAITGTGQYTGQSSIRRGFEATKSAFNAIPQTALAVSPEPIRKTVDVISDVVGKGVDAVTNKISDIPQLQRWTQEHPEAASALEEILGTTSAGGQIAGDILLSNQVARGLQKGVDLTKKGVSSVQEEVTSGVSKVKESVTKKKTPEFRQQQAIKDATPDYESLSPKQKAKVLSQTQEGGVFKGRTLKPTKKQIEAGQELSKTKSYDPNATKLSKYQNAEKEVKAMGNALEKSLKKERIIVPKKEVTARVKTALKEIPEKDLLIQKSDPVIKNYLRVYNNAIKQVDGTTYGIFRLRKILDQTYKNARGGQAFGSDKIAALDNVNRVVRDTLTEYVIEKSGVGVANSMNKQWNLYRAMDVLADSASKEKGSILGRFKQKNPVIEKAAETGAKATGLGIGFNLLD